MDPVKTEQNKLASQSINYWKIIMIFLSRWYWVAGCVLVAYIMAWFYLRTNTPIYITSASLKLDDQQQQFSNLPGSQMSYRGFNSNIIQTEGIIMRSEDVILNAIRKINYQVSYYLEGRVRTTELYPKIPFEIEIIKQDSVNFSRAIYKVAPAGEGAFEISTSDNQYKKSQTYRYGQAINLGNMVFSIKSAVPASGKYSFKFNAVSDFYGRAAGGLNTYEQEKNTNIMGVSHTDTNPVFSADILNEIIKQYVKNDAKLKKRSAQQTIDYLDSQIEFLDAQVSKSGNKLSNFQSGNGLDPTTDRQISGTKLSQLQNQIAELRLQELSIQQLESQIKSNKDKLQLNLNLEGTNSTLLTGLITQFNGLILSRENKLQSFNAEAQPIKDIERQIGDVKQAITTNIRLLQERNEKTIAFINGQIGSTKGDLGNLPAKQNDFAKLQSNFDINQRMFSMLFERKLTAQISAAAVIAGATIIGVAQPSYFPISPIPKKIYSSYMFMGLFIGLGLILLVRIINPYLYDIESIEGLTTMPIIGVILKYPKKIAPDAQSVLSIEKPKSIFAESVRSVRTNLSFMASDKETKVICVTSEVSGEGKSFVSLNLAGTMSIIEKKVIIIAADLRKSKLHKAFGSENKIGLSNYLSNQKDMEEIINHDSINNIDYITSGPVPPNPSELLHSIKMENLINYLRTKYDYIIIDTAPVGLVSDSIPLIRKADINLFIIRSGVSKFRAASIPDRLSKEYGLNNIAIILNSFGDEKLHANIYTTNYVHANSGGYYYSDYTGYGNNGYYDDEKKWWTFWKRS